MMPKIKNIIRNDSYFFRITKKIINRYLYGYRHIKKCIMLEAEQFGNNNIINQTTNNPLSINAKLPIN
jgi:hypothetical protein